MTSSDPSGTNFPTTENPTAPGNPAGGYVPPVDPGYIPVVPPTPPADIYHAPTPDEQPSTADAAKDQAANVAGGAADAAQHVAGVAQEQVGQVAAGAARQVKELIGQAQSELSDQAQVQQQRAASGLHSVADQLKAMATGSDQPGVASDLARQAAGKAHEFASWLENRDPGSVVDEVRSFARQRPGMFLAAALGAGLLAGRLARGLAADPDEMGESSAPKSPTTPRTQGYAAQPAVGSGGQAAAALRSRVDSGLSGTGAVPDPAGHGDLR